MHFDFSDDQQTIKRTARDLLAQRVSPDAVRAHTEAGSYDTRLWAELCDLGWPGIAVPGVFGGQDLGLVELVAVVEELGRALAPVPMLSSVAAALLIAFAGSDDQREDLLPSILSGETAATAGVLAGDTALVPDARAADLIVLAGDGRAHLVQPSAAELEPVETLDLGRRFGRVRATAGEPLPGDVTGAVQRIRVVASAEILGIADRALELAVSYTHEREQFGRPIGSFQAVAHRCADMTLDVEALRSLVHYAAWAADADPQRLPLASAMAARAAADRGWRVCGSALQVFGGIGFTWEHDIHLFLRRARTTGSLFGTARDQQRAVADLVMADAH